LPLHQFGHEYYGLPKGFRESALNNEIEADAAGEDDLFPGETVRRKAIPFCE